MSKDLRDSIEETKRLIERSVLPNEKVPDGALLMQLLFNQLAIMGALDDLIEGRKSIRSRNNNPF